MSKKFRITGRILKRVLAVLLLLLLICLTGTTIWNKFHSIKEDKALSKVGEEVCVNDKNIRVSLVGEGNKTIVLLSGMGTPSPIIDFKPLADKLSKHYRVITLEYLGYGLSEDSNENQTNQAVVEEIRSTLKQLDLKPPYILMPHSISGIYCLQYMNTYPEEVEAMIGIDPSVPNQIKNESSPVIPNGLYDLVRFMDATGLTRLFNRSGVSFVQQMEESASYTKEDIKNVTALVNQRSITKVQYSENRLLNDNCRNLFDAKYPEKTPVLQILSSDTCKSDPAWIKLHREIISNSDIQKIEYLEGNHYLHWTQSEAIADMTEAFLSKCR